jgi:ketosteroid isomerase-like protein
LNFQGWISPCPESPLAFGREAYAKRVEGAIKNGFRDYPGKVKEAHVLSDDRAWTTGTYTFIVNDKDGKSQQAQGNWIDMLRREGTEWKVIFQAYARTPC